MSPLRRLWNIVRRACLSDDLQQELDTHLAPIEEKERGHGSNIEEARQKSRSRFGSPLSYRERALDAVFATWFEDTLKETIFATRRLVRSPAFTLAAVLTLALAIAANASIFAVVERVVLNPLPYPDSDRLIELDHGSQRLNVPAGMGLTLGLYYQYFGTLTHAGKCRDLPYGRCDAHRRRRSGADPRHTRNAVARVSDACAAGPGPLVHRAGRYARCLAAGRLVVRALDSAVRRQPKHS
jgi:hypothetical protein